MHISEMKRLIIRLRRQNEELREALLSLGHDPDGLVRRKSVQNLSPGFAKCKED